jgi:hypothetical protein
LPSDNLTEKSPGSFDPAVAGELRPVSLPSARRILVCAASLVLPGLGHLLLGKRARALAIFFGIAVMFVLGFIMEGHLFTPVRKEWLTWFFSFLDTGIGLPYFVCLALDFGFKVEPAQAARITFEYGNTFLMVAGALNMLSTMDAYDIAIGRKV